MLKRVVGLDQPLLARRRLVGLPRLIGSVPPALFVEETVSAALTDQPYDTLPLRKRVNEIGKDLVLVEFQAVPLRRLLLSLRGGRGVNNNIEAVERSVPLKDVQRIDFLHVAVQRLVRHHPQQCVSRGCRVVGHTGDARRPLSGAQCAAASLLLLKQLLVVRWPHHGLALALRFQKLACCL